MRNWPLEIWRGIKNVKGEFESLIFFRETDDPDKCVYVSADDHKPQLIELSKIDNEVGGWFADKELLIAIEESLNVFKNIKNLNPINQHGMTERIMLSSNDRKGGWIHPSGREEFSINRFNIIDDVIEENELIVPKKKVEQYLDDIDQIINKNK
jgi:hypothetical protein